jgi:hypothetical protein
VGTGEAAHGHPNDLFCDGFTKLSGQTARDFFDRCFPVAVTPYPSRPWAEAECLVSPEVVDKRLLE